MVAALMSRVLALIGNRPNICAAAAQRFIPNLALSRETVKTASLDAEGSASEDRALKSTVSPSAAVAAASVEGGLVDSPASALGWGLGFYQAGQPLLRRRPVDEREIVQISAFHDISSAAYLAQIRSPTVGALRTENTPPFRFRKWLFSMRGTIPNFSDIRSQLVAELPAFVRANVRGQSDGEYVFHSFLASLESAVGLAREVILPGDIAAALARSVAALDNRLTHEGLEQAQVDCFATNGEHLVALHRSGTLSYRWMEGAEELSAWLAPSLERTGTELFRCSLLIAGLQAPLDRWQALDSDSLILCSRTEPPVIQGL